MSRFLTDYIAMGFSNIVVLQHEYFEDRDGRADDELETVVAQKGRAYAKVAVSRRRYLPYKTSTSLSTDPITRSEYDELSRDKCRIDTPTARRDARKAIRRQRRYAELKPQRR
ncbi:MAG TPA: hypothetical protein VG860_04380 [Terriglobia bacterium]|jgi:hypothetical protein|nr:hypothetical protein [Terriglobia bacterium]